MESHNPYQPSSEMPVEQYGDPHTLPASAYIGAGCSAVFVFVGGTLALGLGIGLMFSTQNLGAMMVLASAPLIAMVLGGISFYEALRLERRKRLRHFQAMDEATKKRSSDGE